MHGNEQVLPVAMSNFLGAGRITNVSELGYSPGTVSTQYLGLPILYGKFSELHVQMNEGAPSHMGFGMLDGEESSLLTFRFQLGTSQLFWLAAPTDPAVWDMLDQWSRRKRMAYMMDFNGRVALVSCDFLGIPPALERLRQLSRKNHTGAVAQRAIDTILSGALAANAVSDLPSVADLQHVEACLVATPKLVSELNRLGVPMSNRPR